MADLADNIPLLPAGREHQLVRGNAESTVRLALSTSLVMYWVSVVITCSKLIAEICVLCFDKTSTSKPLAVWVQGCIFLDLMQLLVQAGRLPYIRRLQEGDTSAELCFTAGLARLTAL
jgi:hypothetical protein